MSVKQRPVDRGSVTVMFALFAVVLLGVGVITIDVARLYVEGRQLQNGAESTAVATARKCALGSCPMPVDATLANKNAFDNLAQVAIVCGTAPGLSGCTGNSSQQRFGCAPVSSAGQVVEVRTRTLENRPDGGDANALMPGLIKLVNPSNGGTGVRACARAAFGPPKSLTGNVPLTLSACEWKKQIEAKGYAPPPDYVAHPATGYSTYPMSFEGTLYFHTGNNAAEVAKEWTCSPGQAGMDDPLKGGFGWLGTEGSPCVVATNVDGTYSGQQGNGKPKCDFTPLLGKVVVMPAYGNIIPSGTANKYDYDPASYVAFYLTGFNFSGTDGSLWGKGTEPCKGSVRCIRGWFLKDVPAGSGEIGTGISMGVTIVNLAG